MRPYILVILIFIAHYSCSMKAQDNKLILRCLYYPTGTSKAYQIDVYENENLLISSFGNKNNDSLVVVKQTEKIQLSQQDVDRLKKMIVEIKDSNVSKKEIRKGGWEIIFICNKGKYNYYLDEQIGTPLYDLFLLLERLSPLPIVSRGLS